MCNQQLQVTMSFGQLHQFTENAAVMTFAVTVVEIQKKKKILFRGDIINNEILKIKW